MDSSIESLEEDAGLYDVVQHQLYAQQSVVIVNMQVVQRDHRITPRDIERNWQRRQPTNNKHRTNKRSQHTHGELLEEFPRKPLQRPRRQSVERRNSFTNAVREGVSSLQREISGFVSEGAAAFRLPRSRSVSRATPTRLRCGQGPTAADRYRHDAQLQISGRNELTQGFTSFRPNFESKPPPHLTRRNSTGMVHKPDAHRHFPLASHGRSASARYHYSLALDSQHISAMARRHSNESYHPQAPPSSPASSRRVPGYSFSPFSQKRNSPTGVQSDIGGKSPKSCYLDGLFEWASVRPPPLYDQRQKSDYRHGEQQPQQHQ